MNKHRQSIAAFALGVLCTMVGTLVIGADRPDAPTAPRYMISSWARPHDPSRSGDWDLDHGAYRVDTVTGSVLEINGNRCGDVK